MPAGRPPAERQTAQTRAWADQVEMLQWLYRLKGITSADFIGPRIDKELRREFGKIRHHIAELDPTAAVLGGEG